jgi:hypothetical protein
MTVAIIVAKSLFAFASTDDPAGDQETRGEGVGHTVLSSQRRGREVSDFTLLSAKRKKPCTDHKD